jgi:hypothetical protein
MKKTAENRYPHSATLFKFCKEALEIKYEGNVKVIDQDVGAILGYDPADCSHWKKGKKNIRSLGTIRNIADHLNIDERLLIDITSGQIGLDEAVFEYNGYGSFSLQGQRLEQFKKEYFRNPQKWEQDGVTRSFEELFAIDRAELAKIVSEILNRGNFREAPIYFPEVFQLFPNISLEAQEDLPEAIKVVCEGAGRSSHCTIYFRGSEIRPYLRFLVAKELFRFLCQSQDPIAGEFSRLPVEVQDIASNIFASMLLVPRELLRREVEKLDSSLDIITQLAEIFWTSKALMNQRLRDYMENFN